MNRHQIYSQFLDDFEFIHEWFWEACVEDRRGLFGEETMRKFDLISRRPDFRQRLFIELLRQNAIEPAETEHTFKNGKRQRWLSFRFKCWNWNPLAMKSFRRLKNPAQPYLIDVRPLSEMKLQYA